ncbi:MAG: RNA polymerase sigma factor [Desulfobulbaceae bacterium]|nr:MAG: RNA polymerase sigma factor [Desulfobulbaceae bacterium]
MHPTDKEIVREVLAGKKQRFAEIVTRYQQPVFNLMLRSTRDEYDAADLTQEVFCKAYKKLATYRPEFSLFSWLYTLAINVANDWGRSQARAHRRLQALKYGDLNSTIITFGNNDTEAREREKMLEAALAQLQTETREILILRYRHEQPVRDVASAFKMTESAVKMRVKRGLEQLQKILSEMNDHVR